VCAERQIANAVPCPSRSPSRIKPEMGHQKVVVFLRERMQEAGHTIVRTCAMGTLW
jgi:hypothetical protein